MRHLRVQAGARGQRDRLELARGAGPRLRAGAVAAGHRRVHVPRGAEADRVADAEVPRAALRGSGARRGGGGAAGGGARPRRRRAAPPRDRGARGRSARSGPRRPAERADEARTGYGKEGRVVSRIELEDKLRVSRKADGALESELTVPELARLAIVSGDSRPQADCRIIFNRTTLVGREFEYMMRALKVGHISGNGSFTRKVEALLEAELGAPRVLLTTSCTHALEMAALLLDLRPGDEVVVPSFTFVSTVNAFVLRGARPIFCDIRPDTLNMDERLLPGLITARTRAVVPVHYAGVGCEMDAILRAAEASGVWVVEDNAHGLMGRSRGRPLGTFGRLATLSFHETKNFSCGEGGALVLNDPSLVQAAEVLREKGTNRGRFFRGEVDKYTWVDVGSSYLPSDMLSAFLFAQLEQRHTIQQMRSQIWHSYHEHLQDWAEELRVQLPTVPAETEQAYHMFYMLLPSLEVRTRIINHLKARGIQSVFHYLPLHVSDMGVQFGGKEGDCPVTES